jgi:hypothetical protein
VDGPDGHGVISSPSDNIHSIFCEKPPEKQIYDIKTIVFEQYPE